MTRPRIDDITHCLCIHLLFFFSERYNATLPKVDAVDHSQDICPHVIMDVTIVKPEQLGGEGSDGLSQENGNY